MVRKIYTKKENFNISIIKKFTKIQRQKMLNLTIHKLIKK